jgi:hypothetical protein
LGAPAGSADGGRWDSSVGRRLHRSWTLDFAL